MFQRSVLPPSSLITLMMEAVQTSEMSVNSYQSTLCYNPEDSRLHFSDLESFVYTVIYIFIHKGGEGCIQNFGQKT
jgi:hypothetical protein